MAKLNPPESFDFTQPQRWPEWIKRFQRYRKASKLDKDGGEVQVSTLINTMDLEAETILDRFALSEREADNFDTVLSKFNDHFRPTPNYIHEHAVFNQRNQAEGENVEQYVRALFELAARCNFGENKPMNIRDRLVVGLRDSQLSQELQLKHDLTLDMAIEIARQSEQVKSQVSEQMQASSHTSSKDLDEVRKYKPHYAQRQTHAPRAKFNTTSQNKVSQPRCTRCNKMHDFNQCPAYNAECRRCHKRGHFAVCCRSKPTRRSVSEMQVKQNQNYDTFSLDGVTVNDETKPWFVNLPIGGSSVTFKLDCGADVTVMSNAQYGKLLTKPTLTKSTNQLVTAGGNVLQCYGLFKTKFRYKGRHYRDTVYVAECAGNLLSRKMCIALRILTLNIGECTTDDALITIDVFGELGLVTGEPVKITLKEGTTPFHVTVARRVALPLMDQVEAELQRMETLGVIKKITQPTEWCAPMAVSIKRNGKIRICVDLRQLNRSVKRERYILPTIQDIASRLQGATVFSTLDAASGYYQLPLNEESQKLTTFITPFGRYMFTRLPFGITSASEIFQRTMSDILSGIPGVAVYQDDIIVSGTDMQQHDARLDTVFKTIGEAGLKLNKDKCVFRQKQLEFLGHQFSAEGMSPSTDKVKAINELKPPTNVAELRRILGMVNYLGSYIPNLSDVIKPLNELLKKDNVWRWDNPQKESFIEVKKLLTRAPTLAYFDAGKPTLVSADSSSCGLGAVLLQENRPVAYASRTLLPSERNYAMIEKECLALTWACEKFHRFLYGLPSFRLMSDHKPLVPLINSDNLNNAPRRCQRMLMRLMKYNAVAEYVPGRNQLIADTLSRQPLEATEEEVCQVQEIVLQEQIMRNAWPVSDGKLGKIREASAMDDEISTAIDLTLHGWPAYARDVPTVVKSLYEHREHFSVANGLFLYDSRLVVPQNMRKEILEKIHLGHQGITKSRERANSCVWWPGISKQIKKCVEQCSFCQVHRNAQKREPLKSTPVQNGPYERIAADLFYLERENYLVVIDYYSRYPEIIRLTSTTSQAVIAKLKFVFARWGIPYELVTDNGPQFSSDQFRQFSEDYNFTHITTSPMFPQANGEAERFVGIAKKILRQDDPFMALLVYRNTPNSSTGMSPAQLMMNRNLRTTLPVLEKQVRPQDIDHETARQRDEQSKARYAHFYNRRYSTKPLEPLNPGDVVRLRDDTQDEWSDSATVVDNANTPRSYNVQLQSGNILRRNRRHLQKESEPDDSAVPAVPGIDSDSTEPCAPNEPVTVQRTKSGRKIKPVNRLDL